MNILISYKYNLKTFKHEYFIDSLKRTNLWHVKYLVSNINRVTTLNDLK